jgi:hypothetical protein
MATTGGGINHEDTKRTDKCGNNKIKKTHIQNEETTRKYFSKYCEYNTQKMSDIKYVQITQDPCNKQ